MNWFMAKIGILVAAITAMVGAYSCSTGGAVHQTAQIIYREKTVAVENVAVEQKLQNQVAQITTERDQLKRKLDATSDAFAAYRLSADTVRVLNTASGNAVPSGGPEPADSLETPPGPTLGQYNDWVLDTVEQYNKEALRCDTLRDVVAKQQTEQ